MTIQKLSANGILELPLGWLGALRTITIVGGPWDAFPGRNEMFGVCVRAERVEPGSFDAHVPIQDFSVPRDARAVEDALKAAFRAAIRGRGVYVGCMGGWGRTGLFLALMAKSAGIPHPVDFVRHYYAKSAVETAEQKHYVETFDVRRVRFAILREAWIGWLFRA